MINSFKDLIVWNKSIALAKLIYQLTEKFPKSELFGIVSQMRRASVSIPANIAEGFSRKHRKEYKQFLLISFGLASELETYLILSKELGFLRPNDLISPVSILEEVQKMLYKMVKNLSSYD